MKDEALTAKEILAQADVLTRELEQWLCHDGCIECEQWWLKHDQRIAFIPTRERHLCKLCHRRFYSLRSKKYCSGRCKTRRYREKHPYKRLNHLPRPCVACDRIFKPVRKHRRYCSGACRVRDYRHREGLNKSYHGRALYLTRETELFKRYCLYCKAYFETYWTFKMYCSHACRTAAWRLRKREQAAA